MSDWMVITIGIVIAVGAALGCAAVINSAKQPSDIQRMLNREPLFGKDFFLQYYPELPRRVVFDIRSEFATLIGVPADFVLPEDRLAAYAPPESADAMRGYVALLVSSIRGENPPVVVEEELGTLDDYIRAAANLCAAAEHAPREG